MVRRIERHEAGERAGGRAGWWLWGGALCGRLAGPSSCAARFEPFLKSAPPCRDVERCWRPAAGGRGRGVGDSETAPLAGGPGLGLALGEPQGDFLEVQGESLRAAGGQLPPLAEGRSSWASSCRWTWAASRRSLNLTPLAAWCRGQQQLLHASVATASRRSFPGWLADQAPEMKTPSVGEGVGNKSDLLAIPTLGWGPLAGRYQRTAFAAPFIRGRLMIPR